MTLTQDEIVVGLDGGGVVQYLLLKDTINLRKSSRGKGMTYYKEIARFSNLGTCSSVVHDHSNRWYAGCNDGFIYSGVTSMCDFWFQVVNSPIVEDRDVHEVLRWDIYSIVCV